MSEATIELARLPQAWRDVMSPPEPIARAVRALAPDCGGGILDRGSLGRLVAGIAADAAIWEPLVVRDARRRRYRLAYEDELLDVWVLSWMPGQGTGFHDHGCSAVALGAVLGSVVERRLLAPTGTQRRVLEPGGVQTGDAGYIHSVGHAAGAPAVTVHAYSPPLGEVGQYRADAGGFLTRVLQHGRQELLDTTISD